MLFHASQSPLKFRTHYNIPFAIGIGILTMATFCAPAADATTIYTYTGKPFESVSPPIATGDRIKGSFTMETLAPNLVAQFITPLTYEFTDGHYMYNPVTNPPDWDKATEFLIWTNGEGDITAWRIHLGDTFCTRCFSGYPYMESANYVDGQKSDIGDWTAASTPWSSIHNSPGRWTRTISGVPEPSSFVLVATALLASAFVARRRVAPGIRQFPQIER